MSDPYDWPIPDDQYCHKCREWRPCACDDEARERLDSDVQEIEPWPEPEYTDEELEELARNTYHAMGLPFIPIGAER